MSILEKILQKRGIKSVDELAPDEKADYEKWRSVLTKDELTTEDIKNFCRSQVEVIEMKWRDLDVEQGKKAELIPYHTVYRLLLLAIEAPSHAREALEKNLTQLLQ